MDFVKNHKVLVTAGAVFLALVIVVVSMFSYVNGIRDEGIRKENDLVATYNASQAELSAYTNKITESLGVADAGTEAANTIISNAIKGRYEGNMEPGTGGSMFSAITEAYPDLAGNMKQYEKVQTMVESGRDSFKGTQNKMQSRISDYNTWRDTGLFKSTFVRTLGFPSERLSVEVNGQTFTGQAALDKMKQVIMSTDAANSFETGISDPIIGGKK